MTLWPHIPRSHITHCPSPSPTAPPRPAWSLGDLTFLSASPGPSPALFSVPSVAVAMRLKPLASPSLTSPPPMRVPSVLSHSLRSHTLVPSVSSIPLHRPPASSRLSPQPPPPPRPSHLRPSWDCDPLNPPIPLNLPPDPWPCAVPASPPLPGSLARLPALRLPCSSCSLGRTAGWVAASLLACTLLFAAGRAWRGRGAGRPGSVSPHDPQVQGAPSVAVRPVHASCVRYFFVPSLLSALLRRSCFSASRGPEKTEGIRGDSPRWPPARPCAGVPPSVPGAGGRAPRTDRAPLGRARAPRNRTPGRRPAPGQGSRPSLLPHGFLPRPISLPHHFYPISIRSEVGINLPS